MAKLRLFVIFASLAFLPLLSVAAEVPLRPEFGVLDQALVLPLPVLKASERLVAEHQHLTQEQISIYTIAGAPKGSVADAASAVFEDWRRLAPRPPNAVLIVVDAANGELEIRTGLGIDPILQVTKIAEIRKSIFKPEWDAGQKSRALVLSFVEILRAVESPLVSGNEAVDAFERAGFSGGWNPVVPATRSWSGWIFAFLGLGVAGFVLVRIMIGETHYTATGWFRIPAARNLRRLIPSRRKNPSLVTGGGVSGSY